MKETKKRIFDLAEHKNVFDRFVYEEIVLHQNKGLYLVIYQLLAAWDLLDVKENVSELNIEKLA